MGGTHQKEDLNRVGAADGNQVGRIVFIAGTYDIDLCSVGVADVHGSRTRRATRRLTKDYPGPVS